MSSSVTGSNDINAFGIRAHDGTAGAGGQELNIYSESFYILGVNDNGRNRDYDLYPYVTSGCNADVNDFDFDASGGNPFGSLDLRSRLELAAPGSGFTHTNPTMSANDTWQSVPFSGWTSADTVEDYGIWEQRVNVADYGPGNYGIVYLRAFDADAGEPPPTSQPETTLFATTCPRTLGQFPPNPTLPTTCAGFPVPIRRRWVTPPSSR